MIELSFALDKNLLVFLEPFLFRRLLFKVSIVGSSIYLFVPGRELWIIRELDFPPGLEEFIAKALFLMTRVVLNWLRSVSLGLKDDSSTVRANRDLLVELLALLKLPSLCFLLKETE